MIAPTKIGKRQGLEEPNTNKPPTEKGKEKRHQFKITLKKLGGVTFTWFLFKNLE